MLSHNNNADLDAIGVDRKYQLLFQVWKELTASYTIDTYQYRIMNSLSALRELGEVIDLQLVGIYPNARNVDECRTECLQLVKHDEVMKNHYLAVWKSLVRHLGKKASERVELRALRHQIDYSYDKLAPGYLTHVFGDLEQAISIGDAARIVKTTGVLVSNCASRGWSTPSLRHAIDILKHSSSDQRAWSRFRGALLSTAPKRYRVYIPIALNYRPSGNLDRTALARLVRAQIENMGLHVTTKAAATEEYLCLAKYKMPEGKEFVTTDVSAFDAYSACYEAIDKYSDVVNMLGFYNYVEPWESNRVSCWVVDTATDKGRKLQAKDLYTKLDHMVNNKKAFVASKELIKASASSLGSKLKASYAYSNMGKASGSKEEKFMNTWVALESLCRGDAYSNIISNVLETVPPALCARYAYRLFRNFIEDCKRCGVELDFSNGTYRFDQNRPQEDNVRDIIAAFNDSMLYEELKDKCSVNSLLVYRCKEMHELATQPAKMFDRIKAHCVTVRQQLARLYRVRNSIAHAGTTSISSLELYTEHLTGYLALFVMELVTIASRNREDKAEVVFEMIKDNYSTFCELSGSRAQANPGDVLQGLIATGIIDLI